jgi:hypothetical protein
MKSGWDEAARGSIPGNSPRPGREHRKPQPTTCYTVVCVKTAVEISEESPFFPRVLVHLVGLGLIVRQRRAVRGGQGAGLDGVPQLQQMLAADPHLTGEFRGRHLLRDAPEDQEDLDGAEVCTLPGVPVNTLKTRRQPLQR